MACGNNCAGCKCGPKTTTQTPGEINAYYDGMIEGVHMKAWYKDGIVNVGTTGKTYKQAMQEIEEEREKALARAA